MILPVLIECGCICFVLHKFIIKPLSKCYFIYNNIMDEHGKRKDSKEDIEKSRNDLEESNEILLGLYLKELKENRKNLKLEYSYSNRMFVSI